MFQTFDNEAHKRRTSRPDWMALLARAPLNLLESGLETHDLGQIQWLRRPETGLMMVQGRVGGTGERFNLGEITVTRCALKLSHAGADSPVGVAYVLGRSHRLAQLAASADALLQEPVWQGQLEARLLNPIRQHLKTERERRQQRAQSTKVDFWTMARESGGVDGEEEAS
jgi:alpha-D-ribose 1-methylphosphonate 5-triphosphate synthase subunit PhnG